MFVILCDDYKDAESAFLDVSLFAFECIPEEDIFIESSSLFIEIPKIKASITFCDYRMTPFFKNVKDVYFFSKEDKEMQMIKEIIAE